jgi:outer membrane protein
MKIFKGLFIMIVCSLFFNPVGRAADTVKIGIIDFQQIYNSSSAGKFAQDEINKKGEAFKSDLQEKQSEIEKLQIQYKKEAPILSKEKKEEMEGEIRLKLNDFRILQDKYRQEFNSIKAKLLNDVKEKVTDLATKIGKEKGYFLIIEKQSGIVLWAKNPNNITEALIKDYNIQFSADNK